MNLSGRAGGGGGFFLTSPSCKSFPASPFRVFFPFGPSLPVPLDGDQNESSVPRGGSTGGAEAL